MIRSLLLGSLCVAALATPASADAALLLGKFKDWGAYSTGTGSGLTCYAMSNPRAKRPANLKRDDVFLMVSDWPGRKIKGEPSITPGYEYKGNVPVYLGIGSEKFEFFSRNEGKAGSAWLRNLNDNGKLISALSGGVSAVASGTSARNTKTVDTYSLAGFGEAMAKVHAVCNM